MQHAESDFEYHGVGYRLFRLAMWTSFLTLITLGLYRFWAKTRIRRYIWSHAALEGEPFEYTGTGLEKLLGFLLAVIFLAVYLGVLQMVLFYFGFALFTEPETSTEALSQIAAIYLSALALLPFLLFAIYRARRYKMARTRWRGIRFGMEKGAWGYVFRAVGHTVLTVLSLGLLLPRQTFLLEKYMTDRSWFGDAKMTQEGSWIRLYPAMTHLLIGIAILILGTFVGVMTERPLILALALPVGGVWAAIGFVAFRVRSFGYLTSHKVLDGDIRLTATPSTRRVVRIYLVGFLVIGVVTGAGFSLLAGLSFRIAEGVMGSGETPVVLPLVVAVLYFLVLLGAGAATLAIIIQPQLAHYITATRVANVAAVDTIRQRVHDTGADAEGFADALDIGGAI